jgi:hypothetical protein
MLNADLLVGSSGVIRVGCACIAISYRHSFLSLRHPVHENAKPSEMGIPDIYFVDRK